MSEYYRQPTKFAKKRKGDVDWYVFDANGKNLGRFAQEIAKVLRGKHRVDFTPNVDVGGGVIVLNSEKISVTGAKEAQKTYRRYTGFMGGLREMTLGVMREKKPEEIVRHAVKGMMPKTKLGRAQLTRLRIFVGEEHNMQSQNPIQVDL